jgi:hypothetical protein
MRDLLELPTGFAAYSRAGPPHIMGDMGVKLIDKSGLPRVYWFCDSRRCRAGCSRNYSRHRSLA